MNKQNWPAAEGYEQLAAILQAAHNEAAYGKGKERHANDLPFHEQRMQQISNLLDSHDGMAFQVIKKLTEGLQFDDHDRRERELLGAINYIAGILVFYRNQLECGPAQTAPAASQPSHDDWEAGEKRMDIIGPNGPTGEHYPDYTGFIDGYGAIEIGDHLPEFGGYLIGFIDGHGIIMPDDEFIGVSFCSAFDFVANLDAIADGVARGFNDWRVPTKDELNLAWVNRDKLGRLGMSRDMYWSATEHSTDYAWRQSFIIGTQRYRLKSSSYRFRPVRTVPMCGLTAGKQ